VESVRYESKRSMEERICRRTKNNEITRYEYVLRVPQSDCNQETLALTVDSDNWNWWQLKCHSYKTSENKRIGFNDGQNDMPLPLCIVNQLQPIRPRLFIDFFEWLIGQMPAGQKTHGYDDKIKDPNDRNQAIIPLCTWQKVYQSFHFRFFRPSLS